MAPYGSWRSPIQASTLTAKEQKLLPHDLQCDEEGKSLFRLEERLRRRAQCHQKPQVAVVLYEDETLKDTTADDGA